MAKVSTRVSRTSGQGVSRKSYQTAYGLGQRGTGGLADFRTDQPDSRNYAKGKAPKGAAVGGIGVTDTAYQPENLSALNELFKEAPAKSAVRPGPAKPKVLK